MRPLFLLLISAELCFAACQSSGSSDNKNKDSSRLQLDSAGHGTVSLPDSTVQTDDSISLSKLKTRFADATIPFEGVWVNEHYADEIRQRMSLRESQNNESKFIVIPGRTLQVTRFIFDFHDGGESLVLVKKDSGYFTYALYNGLCVDTLKTQANGRLKIGREYYFRVGEEDTSLYDLGILEQLLFAGQYMRPDSAGTVVFKRNGEIQGLDSLGCYEPVVDYIGYDAKVDHIRLGKDKKHLNDYGLRFVGDTMMIYSIDCLKYADEDCVSDTLGQLKYSLRRLE